MTNIRKIESVIDDTVGFIKMDLEGYEENALQGAKGIISNQKPVLAVSVYHKRWDIFRMPALLPAFNPEYRFYLRHYGTFLGDTVLYALNR